MRVILRSASPRQLALFSLAWAWLTDTPMPPSVVLCVRLRSCSQAIGCVVEAKYQRLRNKIKDCKLPVKGGTIQLTALADRMILFSSIVSLWLLLFFLWGSCQGKLYCFRDISKTQTIKFPRGKLPRENRSHLKNQVSLGKLSTSRVYLGKKSVVWPQLIFSYCLFFGADSLWVNKCAGYMYV